MKTKVTFGPAFWFFGLVYLHRANANYKCPAPGRYLDPLSDCKKFFFCYEENSELLYVIYNCAEGKLYSVEEKRCITASNLECKEVTGATPITIISVERDPLDYFICQGEGKFVNHLDPDCRSYIICNRVSGNAYSFNLYYCPTEEIFSHITFECVPNHQFVCPTTTTVTYFTEKPTISCENNTATRMTSVQTVSTPLEFICTRTGRFPNSAVSGCSTYILCSQTQTGVFISQTYFCFENSYFDPLAGKCIVDYICQDNSDTTLISEMTYNTETATQVSSTENTGEPSDIIEQLKTTQTSLGTETEMLILTTSMPYEFKCTKIGRFPNLSEAGCRSYILCTANGNGTFTSHSYMCYNSFFDPNIGNCSPEYICQVDNITIAEITRDTELPSTQSSTPQEGESTGPTSDTTFGITNTQSSSQPTTINESTGSTSINVSTYSPLCMPDPMIEFICPNAGRYKDANSTDCKTYILCLKTITGELVYAKLKCEEGTLYSDEVRKCVSKENYSCPILL